MKPPEGPKAGEVRQNPKDGLRYVYIPAGTFVMGCPPGDTHCAADEKPPHEVRISFGFWMGQTEVTVGAYKQFLAGSGKPAPRIPDDSLPASQVNWNDAYDYCSWAGMRLPTEAEWEYAARAGEPSAEYGPPDEIAWLATNSGGGPRSVAQKKPNHFGLYDVLGNLWEWTADWYSPTTYRGSGGSDPKGPPTGSWRVVRGGSWNKGPNVVRLSARGGVPPVMRTADIGFRCAGEVRQLTPGEVRVRKS